MPYTSFTLAGTKNKGRLAVLSGIVGHSSGRCELGISWDIHEDNFSIKSVLVIDVDLLHTISACQVANALDESTPGFRVAAHGPNQASIVVMNK